MGTFLGNCWYAAAWADELGEGILARTIAGIPIAFWRDTAGFAHALQDRCPHRFAPLSRGQVAGDTIQCGYHGLAFDGSGKCVLAPGGDPLPKTRVRDFPLVERHALLWIWTGDAELADPGLVPDFTLLEDETLGWRAAGAGNYLNIKAHYSLMIDNLLDLSHVAYLHKTTLAPTAPSVENGILTVERDAASVTASLVMSDVAAPWLDGARVDQWLDMRWEAPGSLWLEIGAVPAGQPVVKGGNGYAVHLVTPETVYTTHYFFGSARHRSHMSNQHDLDSAFALARRAFETEDGPMLEDCQLRMEGADLLALDPIWLKGDQAAGLARRIMQRLIEAESTRSQ